MEIGKRIKILRSKFGLTQEELAAAAHTTKQTIHKYETGIISNIPASKIKLIADRLETTPAYLMGWADESISYNFDNILPMPSFVKKPRLGTIACGDPILAEQNIDAYDDVPDTIHCDFTLHCKGDSMVDARIMDGDIVYIRQQPTVENGEIAAVLIGDEATLKRVYLSPGTVNLVPCNPKYAPMVFTGDKLNDIRILGKAVGFTSVIK